MYKIHAVPSVIIKIIEIIITFKKYIHLVEFCSHGAFLIVSITPFTLFLNSQANGSMNAAYTFVVTC